MRLSHVRSAGLLLLLTAVATAVSVMTRLSGSDEPLEGAAVQLPVILDPGAYVISGAARTLSGFALVAAAAFLRVALRPRQPALARVATTLLEFSGAVTAISGASMLALAGALPQAAEGTAALVAWDAPGWIGAVDGVRSIGGKTGFFLAGMGLIALGPIQWRMGGVMKAFAVADVTIGVAMLLIWIDAATVMHRVSGVAFLIWLIVSGVWLTLGLMQTGRR